MDYGILGSSAAEWAMCMLEKCWRLGIRLSAWLKWNQEINPEEAVYDIVDAGPRSRFLVLSANGMFVAHNCLGQQFGMGPKSLAQALSVATGDPIDHDGALELVRLFRETYSDYTASVMRLRDFYQKKIGIILANGWRLGPDSPSILSASNVPVQGTGSCILQEACKRIDACGIDIVATMHDSITAYCPENRLEHVKVTMRNCMLQAAEAVLGRAGMKIGEAEVVRHGDWWIHGEKAERDWPKYKKYFQQ